MKMKKMKFAFALLLTVFLTNCGTVKTKPDDNDWVVEEIPKTTKVVKVTAKIGELGNQSDPITITASEIRGNLLYLDVEYSGGCADHEFQVIGSANISKSLPPIRAIELVHKVNGDSCKALEKRKLEIDIRSLAYQQEKGSEIYFTLPGWKEKIYYKYF